MEQKKKSRHRIPWPWGLILAIVFVVGAGYFIGYLWSFLLAVGGLGGMALLLGGIYTAYTSVRDAFWPEKSTLARSIRSQLPYPDGAPGVKELFAMVDKDIQETRPATYREFGYISEGMKFEHIEAKPIRVLPGYWSFIFWMIADSIRL